MATLEVFAHLTARPGQLEGFKNQAAECGVGFKWFHFMQGLEPSPAIPARVAIAAYAEDL